MLSRRKCKACVLRCSLGLPLGTSYAECFLAPISSSICKVWSALSRSWRSCGSVRISCPYRESHYGLAKSAWANWRYQIPESRLCIAPATLGQWVYRRENRSEEHTSELQSLRH